MPSSFPNGSKPCARCGTQIPRLQPFPYCRPCAASKKREDQQAADDLAKRMGNLGR